MTHNRTDRRSPKHSTARVRSRWSCEWTGLSGGFVRRLISEKRERVRTREVTASTILIRTRLDRVAGGPQSGSDPSLSGAGARVGERNEEERKYFSPIFNTQVVTNVSQPTLTRYLPRRNRQRDVGHHCPGGGFHALSINSEGVDVAKWLAAKGVTGFVLKYRWFRPAPTASPK